MGDGIHILNLTLSWYMLLSFLGMIIATIFSYFRCEKLGVSRSDIVNLMGYGLIGAIGGGKLLAIIYMLPDLINNWDKINWSYDFLKLLLSSGFVFYGGLFGLIVMFMAYCKTYKLKMKSVLELAAPAIPLFHIFARLGCFTAGCCSGVLVLPMQLIEACMNFLIFLLIYIMQRHGKLAGKTFYLYMILYGTGRFFLEFYRTDRGLYMIGSFSYAQWISVIMIIVSGLLIMKDRAKKY